MPNLKEAPDIFFLTELKEFYEQRYPNPATTVTDMMEMYTRSPLYVQYTTEFHFDLYVSAFMRLAFDRQPRADIVDVGCCSGFTGIMLALKGHQITFHDYEGVGLEGIRWFCDKHDLETTVVPYGDPLPRRYEIAVALDVIEHTRNHLSFVRWISSLAKRVVICYPLVKFQPPYIQIIDSWVDDEGVRMAIEMRYNIIVDYLGGGRRFMIWEEKHDSQRDNGCYN